MAAQRGVADNTRELRSGSKQMHMVRGLGYYNVFVQSRVLYEVKGSPSSYE